MSGVPVNFNRRRVAFIPGFCKKTLSFLTLRWRAVHLILCSLKKSLYVNKALKILLYSHKGSFYTQQRGCKLPRHHAHALALMLPRLNKVNHGDRKIRIADFALPGSIHRQHIACQLVFRGLPPYQAHTWFAGSAKTAVSCQSSEQGAQLYRL